MLLGMGLEWDALRVMGQVDQLGGKGFVHFDPMSCLMVMQSVKSSIVGAIIAPRPKSSITNVHLPEKSLNRNAGSSAFITFHRTGSNLGMKIPGHPKEAPPMRASDLKNDLRLFIKTSVSSGACPGGGYRPCGKLWCGDQSAGSDRPSCWETCNRWGCCCWVRCS